MKKLKVLSIIPARSGSKGLKNKNILKINGKTLIDYKIDLIKKSKIPSNTIILSTDSKKYAKMFERKVLVPFLRPEKLARDVPVWSVNSTSTSTGVPRISGESV